MRRIFLIIFIRHYLARTIIKFKAHWSSYADASCSFDGFNNLGCHCRINNSSIGRFTYFSAYTSVTRAKIGAFCSIGQECIIGGLAKHPLNWLSTHPAFFSIRNQANYSFVSTNLFSELDNVEIGNDVWIGARVMIIDGCKIGDGAVIAAGAVVVADVPPYAIVGGVPAKIIRYRFDKAKIEELLQWKWWDMSLNKISKLNVTPEHYK